MISSLLVGLLMGMQVLLPLEQWSYGWLFRQRNLAAWDHRVVVVRSTNAPSREQLTDLINLLNQNQTNTVVLDLDLTRANSSDPMLAIAMQRHGQVILRAHVPNPDQIELPNSTLTVAAKAIGHDYLPIESDGMVRQVPTWLEQLPALDLVAVQHYDAGNRFAQSAQRLPQLWINWREPVKTLPEYELGQLLENRIPIAQFRDRIILVRQTEDAITAITPFDRAGQIPTAYFHATVINNLLRDSLLIPLGGWLWWVFLLLSNILWSFCLASTQRSEQHLYRTGVLVLGYLGLAILVLRYGYWVPIATALVLYGLTSLGHLICHNLTLETNNQRLRYLANVDELTQVANRRAFEQYLQQEWQRGMRDSQTLSLILCDVDYFKQFNDYYGHVAGDECLHTIAQVLRETLKRPTDMVARYGGEEFAIVLPNTELTGAEAVAISLISQVRRQLLPHAASQVSHYVTLTLGIISGVPSPEQDWQSFLEQADRSLYRAKRAGRDRIVAQCLETAEESPIIDPNQIDPNQLDDRSVGDDYA